MYTLRIVRKEIWPTVQCYYEIFFHIDFFHRCYTSIFIFFLKDLFSVFCLYYDKNQTGSKVGERSGVGLGKVLKVGLGKELGTPVTALYVCALAH